MLRELIKLTESPRGQVAAKSPEQLAQIRIAAAEKRDIPAWEADKTISSRTEGAQADGHSTGVAMKSIADESRRRELDRREDVQAVQRDI